MGKGGEKGSEERRWEGVYVSFQQGSSNFPHGPLDVVCRQLAVLAHNVPCLVEADAEVVKHAHSHRLQARPLQPAIKPL